MFLATLWLLYVQAFVLKAFCDYCLFSAAIVFLLTGLLIAMPPKRAPSRGAFVGYSGFFSSSSSFSPPSFFSE
jgi:uncharacterized membrane protein